MMRRHFLPLVALCAMIATPAHADPITAAIATTIASLGVSTAVATVAAFVITTVGSLAITKLLAPGRNAQDRQASVTSIGIGDAEPNVLFMDAQP